MSVSSSGVAVDPAFKAVPKTSSAFYIWRIENMTVVPVPKDEYGKFYDGDSYIVYAASERGKPAGPDIRVAEVKNASLEVHIHFWLGLETSQDEAGVAAYKTVELDEYLGGGPTQHREVQGKESPRFRSYFKNGIMLLHGGVASGMRRSLQDPASFQSRLFRIRGRRWSNTSVFQMPAVSWEHMNSGDVFVVETWPAIFVWTGKSASHMEKVQGAKVAQQLREERPAQGVDPASGKTTCDTIPIVFVEEGTENKLTDLEKKVFDGHLPSKKRTLLKAAEEVIDEDQVDGENAEAAKEALKLYHCSDDGGTLKVTEVKDGPLFQDDLDSKDSYIVDSGPTRGIWVWVGQGASQKERVEAMRNAHGFVRKKEYPSHTPVTRVIDGAEPLEFRCLFTKWKLPNTASAGSLFKSPTGRIARTLSVTQKFDAMTMHEQTSVAAQMQMIDDGKTGKVLVWRVEDMTLLPIPEESYGIFYDGDAYVIQYTYSPPGSNAERYILYYWLGLHCAQDEAGAAAVLTVQKDNDEFDGAAVQVRVVQGKEPPHFLVLFSGRTVVLHGGKASKFDGEDSADKTDIPEKFLLQVHGNESYNTRATEVDCRAASLNTNDVFVLRNKEAMYLWSGKGSTGDEREMAKKAAERLGKGLELNVVSEGQEKPEFWEAIGGKEPYADSKVLSEAKQTIAARLFQCSNASGCFKAEEVVCFSQVDLVQEDVMLLDAGESIFLWIGKDSNKEERKLAVETAIEYLKTDPAGRDLNTPIIQVKQGFEPPNFTGFFGAWDTGLWNNHKSFEELRKEVQDANPAIVITAEITNGRTSAVDLPKYPLSVLLEKDPEKLPENVDPTCKELHLSEEDFKTAFNMSFSEYDSFPAWKKANLKKKAGLF
ncbi:villin-1-like [Ischnura elegans]|uniref:villin-1-like n=1 Tax=Ischnura elegans TaxID=197161 RepID=UPI001ED8B5F5|nr:villin-1-like [Ischnura elegans]